MVVYGDLINAKVDNLYRLKSANLVAYLLDMN